MAKVAAGVLKQWQDGETIHAVEYNNERDLIVAAYNDTQDQLDTMKNTASVGTSMLKDGSVTTSKLANSAATSAKIADGAVTEAKVASGAITEAKIALDAVVTEHIQDSAVTTDKINNMAVTTGKLADGSVTYNKLSENSVTTDKINNSAVTSQKISSGAVLTDKLANGAVTTDKVADEAITSSKLADNAVTPSKIPKEAVTQYSYDKNETDARISSAFSGSIPQTVIDEIRDEVAGDYAYIVAAVGDPSELPPGVTLTDGYIDFENHASDTTIHVTQSEKNAWNAKETPLGASNKANTAKVEALQDAKAYVNDLIKVGLLYGITTGSANTYTLSVDSNVIYGALFAGVRISFKVHVNNTGSSTLNVNNLGAKTIKKPNGNNLSAGNLKAGSVYTVVYDGTNFILQGEGGEYGTATASDVRSTKTIGTDAGLVSGSLVTRASSALTITPTPADQVFQPGIYDGTITVKGANVRTTPDLSWLIGAFPSTAESLGLNYVDGRPYIDSQGNIYSGTITGATAAYIQKRDRFGTLLSNVQVGNNGITYITGKTVACRHGVYIYSVSSTTYRNFYDYSGNLLKANPTRYFGNLIRPVDIEWKSNKLYTFARSIGTTAQVLEDDTILFVFSGSTYDSNSDIWILGVSEDMKLVGGDLGINLLYYNGSSWVRAFTTQKTVDSIMPFTFLISALLQAPAS